MLSEVTSEPHDERIYIADDRSLPIVKIGKWNIPARGYELIVQEGVEPRNWRQVPCDVSIPSSRTIVVDGLADDCILLSVRGLLRDGVKTFLNDDNSIQRSDCLLLTVALDGLHGEANRLALRLTRQL